MATKSSINNSNLSPTGAPQSGFVRFFASLWSKIVSIILPREGWERREGGRRGGKGREKEAKKKEQINKHKRERKEESYGRG